MGFTTVYGTYDFLYIPVILPKTLVKNFLPLRVAAISPSPFWDSSSIHRDCGVQLREDDHIVVFHIGRQFDAGPWISKFNFHEAKLEIPYLHHPALEPSTTKYPPFLLKQTVLLDSRFMTLSSRHIIGLRSILAKYEPGNFPELMDQSDISKVQSGGVVDTLKLEVQYKAGDITTDPTNQWTPEIFQKMLSQPFYGEFGSQVYKIVSDFEKPLRAIKAFSGSISIKLPVFQLTSEGETIDLDGLARCNCALVDDNWLKIPSSLLGYHVKVNFVIDGPYPPDYFSS